jgi:hypothetical protein
MLTLGYLPIYPDNAPVLVKRKARLTPCLFQSLILMPVFALPKPGFDNLLSKD